MKKIISLVLCISLIFAFSIFAFADDKTEISLGNIECAPGGHAIMSLSIKNNPGFGAFGATIKYDSSVLSLDNAKAGELLSNSTDTAASDKPMALINTSNAGTIHLGAISAESITGDGTLLVIDFVFNSSSVESTDVKVSIVDFTDSEANAYDTDSYTVSNGKITVADIIYGDVSGDRKVLINDALMTLQNVVKKIEFNDAQKKAADVSGDGEVAINDALMILQKVVKKIDKFKVEQ